jgi:hypothetical protein
MIDKLRGVLWQVQKAAGDDFTGVGVLICDVPDLLPIIPLRPVSTVQIGADLLVDSLAGISVPGSEYHDGFHIVSSDWRLIRLSQYFSPPYDQSATNRTGDWDSLGRLCDPRRLSGRSQLEIRRPVADGLAWHWVCVYRRDRTPTRSDGVVLLWFACSLTSGANGRSSTQKRSVKQNFLKSSKSDSQTLMAQPKKDPESGRPLLYYVYLVTEGSGRKSGPAIFWRRNSQVLRDRRRRIERKLLDNPTSGSFADPKQIETQLREGRSPAFEST